VEFWEQGVQIGERRVPGGQSRPTTLLCKSITGDQEERGKIGEKGVSGTRVKPGGKRVGHVFGSMRFNVRGKRRKEAVAWNFNRKFLKTGQKKQEENLNGLGLAPMSRRL